MAEDPKPLSELVAQGWEVLGYAGSTLGQNTFLFKHAVLLRRQRQHKLLTIRRRMFGVGLVVEQLDI